MSKKKTLQDLTIKDNFMFGAVMSDPENCRRLLELILEFPIERVEVHKEKSIVYHPEFHGVRLDVFAKDVRNTRYNVEMQTLLEPDLGKRARYYHGQLDIESLQSGSHYDELSESYVIFICDFDPFGKKRYRYSYERLCLEDKELNLQDKSRTIFLSTMGQNKEEVPAALVNFLEYVHADLNESTKEFEDDFVKRLQSSVRHIKQSRESESEYMSLELHFYDEWRRGKAEGKAETILEMLEEIGPVPEEVRERICNERDMTVLKKWGKQLTQADTVEQFVQSL